MIRLIMSLLGKEYEPCKSCETLKAQLAFANEEKRYLTDTLVNILQPKAAPQNLTELEQIKPKGQIWSRRKAELEEQERQKVRIVADSPFVAKGVEKLEEELGVSENG